MLSELYGLPRTSGLHKDGFHGSDGACIACYEFGAGVVQGVVGKAGRQIGGFGEGVADEVPAAHVYILVLGGILQVDDAVAVVKLACEHQGGVGFAGIEVTATAFKVEVVVVVVVGLALPVLPFQFRGLVEAVEVVLRRAEDVTHGIGCNASLDGRGNQVPAAGSAFAVAYHLADHATPQRHACEGGYLLAAERAADDGGVVGLVGEGLPVADLERGTAFELDAAGGDAVVGGGPAEGEGGAVASGIDAVGVGGAGSVEGAAEDVDGGAIGVDAVGIGGAGGAEGAAVQGEGAVVDDADAVAATGGDGASVDGEGAAVEDVDAIKDVGAGGDDGAAVDGDVMRADGGASVGDAEGAGALGLTVDGEAVVGDVEGSAAVVVGVDDEGGCVAEDEAGIAFDAEALVEADGADDGVPTLGVVVHAEEGGAGADVVAELIAAANDGEVGDGLLVAVGIDVGDAGDGLGADRDVGIGHDEGGITLVVGGIMVDVVIGAVVVADDVVGGVGDAADGANRRSAEGDALALCGLCDAGGEAVSEGEGVEGADVDFTVYDAEALAGGGVEGEALLGVGAAHVGGPAGGEGCTGAVMVEYHVGGGYGVDGAVEDVEGAVVVEDVARGEVAPLAGGLIVVALLVAADVVRAAEVYAV